MGMDLEAIGNEDPFSGGLFTNPLSRTGILERELLLRDRFLGMGGRPSSKKFTLSEKLATKINQVDHKVVSGIIRLIICAKEIDNFEYEFAAACCVNQINRERLLSALLFLLVNRNST